MLKKLLFGVIAMCCCFGMNYHISLAKTLTTEDFVYEVNSDGTLMIIDGNRDIRGEEYHVKSQVEIDGKSYRVTKIDNLALSFVYTKKVYIDEGILEVFPDSSDSEIGDFSTDEVILPSTLKKIGIYRTNNPHGALDSITISPLNPYLCVENGIIYTKNKKKVLVANTTFGKIVLPEGVEEITDNAFLRADITSIELPKSLKKIGERSFFRCSKLTSVKMKDNVSVIGAEAFKDCECLKKVTFSRKIKQFGSFAFANTDVEKVTLGKYIKGISNNVFRGSTHIKKLTIDKKNPYMMAYKNAIYSKDGKTLLNGMGVSGTFTIPKKVTRIKSGAFAKNYQIDIVRGGKNIKSLPSNCFADSGIQFIQLSEGLKTIGKNCFENCMELWEVKLPDSVTTIKEGAFYGCAFDELIISRNIKKIEADALHCAAGELIFRGSKPPRVGEQSEITYEEIEGDEDSGFKNDYRGLDLCVDKLIVPKGAIAKYRKAFKKKLEYNTIKGN